MKKEELNAANLQLLQTFLKKKRTEYTPKFAVKVRRIKQPYGTAEFKVWIKILSVGADWGKPFKLKCFGYPIGFIDTKQVAKYVLNSIKLQFAVLEDKTLYVNTNPPIVVLDSYPVLRVNKQRNEVKFGVYSLDCKEKEYEGWYISCYLIN